MVLWPISGTKQHMSTHKALHSKKLKIFWSNVIKKAIILITPEIISNYPFGVLYPQGTTSSTFMDFMSITS